MPLVGGIEMLRLLKADERTRLIPVIILAAAAAEEPDLIETYRLGASSHLVKPINFSAFAEAVAQAGLYCSIMSQGPL